MMMPWEVNLSFWDGFKERDIQALAAGELLISRHVFMDLSNLTITSCHDLGTDHGMTLVSMLNTLL